MSSEPMETIVINGIKNDLEEVNNRINQTELGEAYLLNRKNLDGDAATWIAAISLAAHSIPFVLSAIREKVKKQSISRIKIGAFEVENPSPEMLQQIIDSYVAEKMPPQNTEAKKKILFVSANPDQSQRSLIDVEMREINEGLRRSGKRDLLDFKISPAVRIKDFTRTILDENPQILHFSGIGSEQGIVLLDEDDKTKTVSGEALGKFFGLFQEAVQCVFLNASFTENLANDIVKNIPFVIGISGQIPEESQLAFSVGFYDAIGAGRDFEFSFKFGRSNVLLNGLEGEESFLLLKK